MDNRELLRNIPKVDELLREEVLTGLYIPAALLREAVRG